jgi:hypothetical protein
MPIFARLPQTTHKAVPAFIELPIADSIAPAVVTADTVHVEIQQGDLSVKLRWPAAETPKSKALPHALPTAREYALAHA